MRVNAASFLILWPILRPDILQGLAKVSFCHGFGKVSLSHQATDPPDLQTREGKSNKAQLDISPVQLLHHDTCRLLAQRRSRECLNCSKPIAGVSVRLKTKESRQTFRPTATTKTIQAIRSMRGLTIATFSPAICPVLGALWADGFGSGFVRHKKTT